VNLVTIFRHSFILSLAYNKLISEQLNRLVAICCLWNSGHVSINSNTAVKCPGIKSEDGYRRCLKELEPASMFYGDSIEVHNLEIRYVRCKAAGIVYHNVVGMDGSPV
jgi:hypothetical protein